jgi:peptide/nickel transport system substrate-binding protein
MSMSRLPQCESLTSDSRRGLRRPSRRTLACTVVLIVALVALTACGSSGKSKSGGATSGGSAVASTGPVPYGGTVVVAAEQEPDCFDWIGQCAGSQWGSWIAQWETQPQAFRAVVQDGNLIEVPGAMLSGMPQFAATPVETITYNIAPAAVWSDGVPISCTDFQYTADQIQNGKDIYDQTGFTDVDKVSCPTPKTVVVTYKKGKTYSTWHTLFAGGSGLFPAHLLQGKDRDKELKNGYTWSGGPWFAKWNKGDSVVLTPNPKYWGPKAHLDKVVFKFEADSAAEFQAFKSHQVDAMYPKPQIDVIDEVKTGIPDANTTYNSKTATVEALWFNNSRAPFNSKVVRQAIGYAIDRDAIAKKLFGPLGVTTAANSMNPAVIADYSDQNAWAGYKLDLDKVNSLMSGDGWTKGSDGIWTKNGKRASFTIVTTAGDKLRELTEQVIQPMLKAAGFDMAIKNTALDNLLTQMGAGNYQLILISQQLTGVTPGLCTVMCTENIPGPSNHNSGNNWSYASVPSADVQMRIVDTSLDDNARKAAAAQADDILADYDVALPLDPSPDILIWNKKIVGPVSDNPIESMFWNIDQWGIKQ